MHGPRPVSSPAVKTGAQLDDYPPDGLYCTGTANALFEACRSQGEPDYWKTVAVCSNIEDDEERRECFDDAAAERRDGVAVCRAQLNARRSVCTLLDEDRHDPEFEPQLFDHDFTRLTRPTRTTRSTSATGGSTPHLMKPSP